MRTAGLGLCIDSFNSLGKEGQLDRALEEAEQRFFLPFRAADLLDLMAAEATELQEFPATPAEAVDAGVAHHLAAEQALVGDLGLLMPRANEGAIRENDGRSRPLDIELGNGDL